jgi:hypothetical protein
MVVNYILPVALPSIHMRQVIDPPLQAFRHTFLSSILRIQVTQLTGLF